jgi:hypothetical protein
MRLGAVSNVVREQPSGLLRREGVVDGGRYVEKELWMELGSCLFSAFLWSLLLASGGLSVTNVALFILDRCCRHTRISRSPIVYLAAPSPLLYIHSRYGLPCEAESIRLSGISLIADGNVLFGD